MLKSGSIQPPDDFRIEAVINTVEQADVELIRKKSSKICSSCYLLKGNQRLIRTS